MPLPKRTCPWSATTLTRPLLCCSNWPPLYHVSERPDGVRWDGIENWDPARKNGVVFAFRGSIENQPEHRFVPAGLNAGKRYRLHNVDGSSMDSKAPGRDLMVAGLPVHLGQPLISELVRLEEDDAQH